MVSLTQLGELAAAVLFVIWAAVLLWHLFGRLLRPMRGERIWMLLPGGHPALVGLVPGGRRISRLGGDF